MKTQTTFEARNYKNTKVEAIRNGKVIGYHILTGFAVYDNLQNEFVIITNDTNHDAGYYLKSVAQSIADQLNAQEYKKLPIIKRLN